MSDSPNKMERELTSEIVSSFLRSNKLPTDQVASLISTVHGALVGLGKPVPENNEPGEPAVSIRRFGNS
jgi:predicted transcriptional regulator